jgi:hypothetical protein
MTIPPDIFVTEDSAKPENRINLSIFACCGIDLFRTWLAEQLGLPSTTVFYPPVNQHPVGRPDFVAVNAGAVVGWIEVEVAKNEDQLAGYVAHFADERVFSVCGVGESDLALVEIGRRAAEIEKQTIDLQSNWHLRHLSKLINHELSVGRNSTPAVVLTAQARNREWVSALLSALSDLGTKVQLEKVSGQVPPGVVRFNSRSSGGSGVSVKVRASRTSSGVAILFQRSSQPFVSLNSADHLNKYLPAQKAAVDALIALAARLGCDLEAEERRLEEVIVRDNARAFASVLAQLCQ